MAQRPNRKGPERRSLDDLAASASTNHRRNYYKRRVRAAAIEALSALYAARQRGTDDEIRAALEALADLSPHLLNATCSMAVWEKLQAELPRDDGSQLSFLS